MCTGLILLRALIPNLFSIGADPAPPLHPCFSHFPSLSPARCGRYGHGTLCQPPALSILCIYSMPTALHGPRRGCNINWVSCRPAWWDHQHGTPDRRPSVHSESDISTPESYPVHMAILHLVLLTEHHVRTVAELLPGVCPIRPRRCSRRAARDGCRSSLLCTVSCWGRATRQEVRLGLWHIRNAAGGGACSVAAPPA